MKTPSNIGTELKNSAGRRKVLAGFGKPLF